jgi:NRPS condensation-like uncharacterized protein
MTRPTPDAGLEPGHGDGRQNQQDPLVPQTPLNLVDELILHLTTAQEPWSIQLEVRVQGRLDADRIAAAARSATQRHPLARARIMDWKAVDTTHQWHIPDRVDHIPLEIIECADERAVADARARLQSFTPRLDLSPPFALTLAHHGGGDYLMLNLHHAIADGLSALRLMTSILRAYAGSTDPPAAADPLAARDLRSLAGSQSLSERMSRLKMLAGHLRENLTPPVPVRPHGGVPRPGYGFHLLGLGAQDTQAVLARRSKAATVNDVLLAALAVTIRRWNERHQGPQGRISIMLPVSLRPGGQHQDLGNFVSYVTVSLPVQAQGQVEAAMAVVAEQTGRFKEEGTAGLLIDLLEVPSRLPAALKGRLESLAPLSGGTILASAVLSNLGRLEPLPPLGGQAGAVCQLWFSPPAHMPMGVAVGAASLGGQLFVALRYRHAQFDAQAAAEFARLYRHVLTGV